MLRACGEFREMMSLFYEIIVGMKYEAKRCDFNTRKEGESPEEEGASSGSARYAAVNVFLSNRSFL